MAVRPAGVVTPAIFSGDKLETIIEIAEERIINSGSESGMRSLFYPVLTLIVILLVGINVLLFRPKGWWPEVPRSLSVLLRQSGTEKPSPMPAQPLQAKGEFGKKGPAKPSQPEPIQMGASGTSPVPAPRPPEKRYPFPVAEQIVPGTPQTTILATFGPPEAKVTGADTGELRERYVYVDRATGRRTFIAMVNAVVTNAQTLTQ